MSTSQDSQAAVGLDPDRPLKDNLTSILDPFERDLKLRGLAKTSQVDVLGCVRRYLIWAAERGIDPAKQSETICWPTWEIFGPGGSSKVL